MVIDPNNGLEVRLEHTPCFNFAFQQNSIPLISRVEIYNPGETHWEDLRLSLRLSPELAPLISLEIREIQPEGSVIFEDVDFALGFDKLSTWSERLRGEIQILLQGRSSDGDELLQLVELSKPVDVYAWNEWTGLQTLPEILCAFITPNLSQNTAVLADASNLLSQRTGDGSFDGYQSGSKERVYSVIGAIFDAMARRNVRYSMPPASFEHAGQKIRFGNGVLDTGFGTCLDLSLWFASLLEQAGLRPLILMHEGHAYVGCWLKQDSFPDCAIDDLQRIRKRVEFEDILVVEATACTDGKGMNLEAAVQEAKAHLSKDAVFHMGVDVSRARANGIRPLPLKETGEQIDPAVKSHVTSKTHHPESGARAFGPELGETENESTETRLDRWKQHLLDLTLRNRLLNFRETKQTIPFACIDPAKLEDALASSQVFRIEPESGLMQGQDPRDLQRLTRQNGESPLEQYLLQELGDKRLRSTLAEKELSRRLLELYRSSKLELQESGANTLFLAVGMLEWMASDASDKSHVAPILLLPVRLERKSVVSGYSLVREDSDPLVNVTLLELLRRDFGIMVPGLDPLPEDDNGIDVDLILKRFAQTVLDYKGWEVHLEVWLGRFSFNKFLLWKDLQDRLDHLTKNPVVDHLVNKPGEPFDDGIDTVGVEKMDEVTTLKELFTPLSSDSSQLAAVVASAEGKNFVLYGPPGTGKSQTIANIITHNMALGRTVLFVAEKRAALEVVHSRLAKLGLAEFCLELHSNKTGKADVLKQFGQALDMANLHEPEEWAYISDQLELLRNELNQRVRELHRPGPAGISPYQCYSFLTYHSETASRLGNVPRLTFADLDSHTRETLDHMRGNLRTMILQLDRVDEVNREKLLPFGFLNWTPDWEHQACEAAQSLITTTAQLKEQYGKLGDTLGLQPLSTDRKLVPESIQFAIKLTQGEALPRSFVCDGGWEDFANTVRSEWIPALETYRASMQSLEKFNIASLEQVDIQSIEQKFGALGSGSSLVQRIRRYFTLGPIRKCLKNPKEGVPTNWKKGFFTPYADLVKSHAFLMGIDSDGREKFGRHWKGLDSDPDLIEECLSYGETLHQGIVMLAGTDAPRLMKLKSGIADFVEQFDDLLGEGKPVYQVVAETVGKWNLHTAALKSFRTLLGLNAQMPFPGDGYFQQMELLGRACLDARESLRYWGAWQRGRSVGIEQGLAPLVESLEQGHVLPADAEICFELGYRTAILNHLLNTSEILRNFFGDEQEESIRRFRKLDSDYLSLTAQAARARLASNLPRGRHQDAVPGSEMGLLQRERVRKRRHKPIRTLLGEIPTLLPKMKPCLLMSPLSVAQYLDAETASFDLVVFDEASQIPVWDAVGAIARGKQVIVAGDPKQLPPTNFFGRSDSGDEIEDLDLVEDQESILDECMGAGLPCNHLNWHYRSLDESLIAFSNHHYYENRLFTFPSPDTTSTGVRWVHVPEGHYDKGRTRTNRAEGERVVQEIQNRLHDPERNTQSIGVVTFSQAQQVLIENLLDELRMKDPSIEAYFDEEAVEESIFVKNLENVQGDERDVIIFSIGYGPDASGKPSMNFGPLNRDGGERRLNVAVTRAKREVVLISTLRPEQIDLSRTRSLGVAQLKAYMEYAQRGPRALGDQVTHASADAFDSLFEQSVCAFLESKGYHIHTQVGCSGYRIDLAIVDPENPGKYLVGIECDGATYHRAATARDRDRLRQQVLEGLGWQIVRVWSTDWWNGRSDAENRLLEAVELAIEHRNSLPEPQENVAGTEDVEKPSVETPVSKDLTPEEIPVPPASNIYTVVHQNIQQDQPKFYEGASTGFLQQQMREIIEKEGPICEDLLVRRVAEGWGFGRVGPRIRDRVVQAVNAKSTHEPEGHCVYWPAQTDPSQYDEYRVPDETDEKSIRPLESIPGPEIRNAMVTLIEDNGSMPVDALLRETLKIFGWKQLSKAAKTQLEKSLKATQGKLVCIEDQVSLESGL